MFSSVQKDDLVIFVPEGHPNTLLSELRKPLKIASLPVTQQVKEFLITQGDNSMHEGRALGLPEQPSIRP